MNYTEGLYEEIFAKYHRISTDSRNITPGCIFFAFKGEHFDGNNFAEEALRMGAAACVVEKGAACNNPNCIHVDNVLTELQKLAAYHRKKLNIPFIGITGTNGKTTTKELIKAVLGKKYRTAGTMGNYNNHLGVPLTILSIDSQTEVGIIEMGANHPGEIADLCKIADPDYGLITNVGEAHLEGFGSIEGVLQTKTELYRYLYGKHGTVFVNGDDERLMKVAIGMATIPSEESLVPFFAPGTPDLSHTGMIETSISLYTYGAKSENNARGTMVENNPYMHFYFEVGDNVYNVRTKLLGKHNFYNAMAAVSIGLYFDVDPYLIKEAIEEYTPRNNRSEWKATKRNTIYFDCYNANPSSMKAAIDTYKEIKADKKLAIIGGMKELGEKSEEAHIHLVEWLEESGLDGCILIGKEFDDVPKPAGMIHYRTTEECMAHLKENIIDGYMILLKGSNSYRLWTLEEYL